ncbi:MAG: hypothetical protein AAF437_14960 [Pseudomonadota bacterium]
MKPTPRIFSLTALAAILAACAAPASTDGAAEANAATPSVASKPVAKLGPAISTIKPGASVSFSHETSGPVDVDGNGYVTITVNEGYPGGTLELVASANGGLEVVGPGAIQTVSMANGTTHSWRVDYRGLSDGVHYLNIAATANVSSDVGEMRGYAVRVEVGDWKPVEAAREAAKSMQEQASGEMAVIMEAEETIE